MEKKYIIGILIIVILLLIGFILISNTDKDHIKVDNMKFKIPDGYAVVDDEKYYNLTNGKETIIVEKKVGSLDINSTIKNYLNLKEKENASIKVSTVTVDDTIVYKVNTNNSKVCHYWFEDNSKVYSIFTLKESNNTDSLAINLIKSKSNSMF